MSARRAAAPAFRQDPIASWSGTALGGRSAPSDRAAEGGFHARPSRRPGLQGQRQGVQEEQPVLLRQLRRGDRAGTPPRRLRSGVSRPPSLHRHLSVSLGVGSGLPGTAVLSAAGRHPKLRPRLLRLHSLLQQYRDSRPRRLHLPVRNHRPRSRPTRAASVGAHANLASADNGCLSRRAWPDQHLAGPGNEAERSSPSVPVLSGAAGLVIVAGVSALVPPYFSRNPREASARDETDAVFGPVRNARS